MITKQQIRQLSKEFKISDFVIVREFIQLSFLKELYEESFSKGIFFKGGTAIRLIYQGQRFSEDLDFTVSMKEEVFEEKIALLFKKLENTYPFSFKKKRSISGYTYLLTADIPFLEGKVYVKLDFSTREKVLEPTQTILKTSYPIVFQSFVNVLSINEIFAEKIRAVMTRVKHRDLYDLWVLQELGAKFDRDLVLEKLRYYNIDSIDSKSLEDRLSMFSEKGFVSELHSFVPRSERDTLPTFYNYILHYLMDSFKDV